MCKITQGSDEVVFALLVQKILLFYCLSKNMIHFDSKDLEPNRPWEHHWYENDYSCSHHNMNKKG